MNILVAEDNAQSLYLLERYLASRGHTVWSAVDGRAAWDLLESRGLPDAIVSDALMPRMDGFELCIAVRGDARFHEVPFILYTATYTSESDERFALSVGVDRFVVKPVEPEQLLSIVEDAVAGTKTRAGHEAAQAGLTREQLADYSRMVLVKLEDKLLELSRTNTALTASQEAVRSLNEKLVATVHHLEAEIDRHERAAELLRMAQQAGGIGCWESHSRDRVYWAPEALSLLGYSGGEKPASFADFLKDVVEIDRSRASQAIALLDEPSATTLDLEVRFQPAGQKDVKHLLLRGARFSNTSDRRSRWLGIIQDTTIRREGEVRRQMLEQQLFRSQKMEALGNLAGGIAHDFNNILAAILGNAELLARDLRAGSKLPSPSSPAYEYLGEITNAGIQAREIIKQILMFSRRQPIERRPVVFSKTIEDSLRLVRATIKKNHKIKATGATSRSVCANESQIQQVLLNLCTNAAQAMEPKGGTIQIDLSDVDIETPQVGSRGTLKPGHYVCLRVSDTGPGIPVGHLDRIFEPFFTTKPQGEGTGLGLAVVHGIVQAHEGFITVDSTPGQGSTFSLFFPVVKPVQATPDVRNQSSSVGKPVILIVDDEPSVARSCAQLLNQLDYATAVFTDPGEARDAFERDPHAYAAAMVDFAMPRINGLELARAFWRHRPEFQVILVASLGGRMDAQQAKSAGFCEFVAKPFTGATLSAALTNALAATKTPSAAVS